MASLQDLSKHVLLKILTSNLDINNIDLKKLSIKQLWSLKQRVRQEIRNVKTNILRPYLLSLTDLTIELQFLIEDAVYIKIENDKFGVYSIDFHFPYGIRGVRTIIFSISENGLLDLNNWYDKDSNLYDPLRHPYISVSEYLNSKIEYFDRKYIPKLIALGNLHNFLFYKWHEIEKCLIGFEYSN